MDQFAEQELIVLIFSGLYVISYIVQIVFYIFYFRKAILKNQTEESKKYSAGAPVSIIICARNEAENLRKNLPLILEQDYPEFEVVVVDDLSEDDTEDVLKNFSLKYPHLKLARVKFEPQFINGKKLGLTLGIKACKHELLLFTDADCSPAGNKWLSLMQRNFSEKTEIVLGYGGYTREQGILNLVIRYETVFTAMSYFGMACAGRPYMGVGRNLAYKKSLFFKNNGFGSHAGIASGDDDLFVNETATKNNVAVEINPESFTFSEPEKDFSDWMRQKKRHLSTARRYKSRSKYMLITENLSRMILLISFIFLLFSSPFVYYILASYLILAVTKSIIFTAVCKLLQEKQLLLPSLFFEPLFPFFYSLMHMNNYFNRNQTKWK